MRVVGLPHTHPQPPKPPSWWRTFGLPTGAIVEHNGAFWRLVERWSWGDYEGRGWERCGQPGEVLR